MVAVAAQILHEKNFKAEQSFEIFVGADKIVRINVDGVCAIRVRLGDNCFCRYEDVLPLLFQRVNVPIEAQLKDGVRVEGEKS